MLIKMDINKIKILPMFWACPPKEHKVLERLEYFAQTGDYGRILTLDAKGWLVDGFASYIAMRRNHELIVPVNVLDGCMRPAIQCEDCDGTMDWYMVPMRMARHMKPGNRVVLFTRGRIMVMRVRILELFSSRPVWSANGFVLPYLGQKEGAA